MAAIPYHRRGRRVARGAGSVAGGGDFLSAYARVGRVWEPLGFFLLAVLIRALPYPSLLRGDGGLFFFGNDAYYHARRVAYSVLHFPAVLWRDPYMNFPEGGQAIWPPTVDWLAAGLVRVLFGADDPAGMEATLAWLPPILGGLTVAGVYVFVRAWDSRAAGCVAAAFLALLPAHIWYSQIGFFDHHVVTALVTLGLLVSAMAFLRLPSDRGARFGSTRVGCLGAFLAISLLVWPGCLLHVAVVEAALALRLVTSQSRDEAVVWALRSGCANVLALLLVFPFSAGNHWDLWGDTSPLVLSRFQPLFFGALALWSLGLGGWWRSTASAAPQRARLREGVALGFVGVAVLLLVAPEIGAGAGDAFGWFLKAEPFQAGVAESKALFRDGFRRPEELLTRLLYALPILLIAFGRKRRPLAAADWLFLGWTAVLAGATLFQLRFMNSFSVAFAILAAMTLVPIARSLLRSRTGRPALRVVGVAAALAVLATVYAPSMRTQWRHIENLAAWVAGEPVAPVYLARLQAVRSATAAWQRAHSAEAAGGLGAGDAPGYAVLAPWSAGHVLKYVGHRAVLHDNFGDDVAPENSALVRAFYSAANEREALQLLDGIDVRYVWVRDPGPERLHTANAYRLDNRLFRFRGSGKWVVGEGGVGAPRHVPALERHRLIFESVPLLGRREHQSPLYRIFEIVPGATLEGVTDPGTAVTLRLPLRSGNASDFEYQARAQGDHAGHFSFRVPYSTEATSAAVAATGAYRIEAGFLRAEIRVSEEAIRSGARIPVRLTPGQPG